MLIFWLLLHLLFKHILLLQLLLRNVIPSLLSFSSCWTLLTLLFVLLPKWILELLIKSFSKRILCKTHLFSWSCWLLELLPFHNIDLCMKGSIIILLKGFTICIFFFVFDWLHIFIVIVPYRLNFTHSKITCIAWSDDKLFVVAIMMISILLHPFFIC